MGARRTVQNAFEVRRRNSYGTSVLWRRVAPIHREAWPTWRRAESLAGLLVE